MKFFTDAEDLHQPTIDDEQVDSKKTVQEYAENLENITDDVLDARQGFPAGFLSGGGGGGGITNGLLSLLLPLGGGGGGGLASLIGVLGILGSGRPKSMSNSRFWYDILVLRFRICPNVLMNL